MGLFVAIETRPYRPTVVRRGIRGFVGVRVWGDWLRVFVVVMGYLGVFVVKMFVVVIRSFWGVCGGNLW